MSKKHFIRLAEYLRDTDRHCEPFTTRQIEHLADFCYEFNHRFNYYRWRDYIAGNCGPNGGAVKVA
jgi:hypothetical protein